MNTSEESTFNVSNPELKIIDELIKEYLSDTTIIDATEGSMRHGLCPLEIYGFVGEAKLTNMSYINYIYYKGV